MESTDDVLVWPPAIRVELTAQEEQRDGAPAVRFVRAAYQANLDPGGVTYMAEMDAAMGDGNGFQGEQILLDDSLFMRGHFQFSHLPSGGGTTDWVEWPLHVFDLILDAERERTGRTDLPGMSILTNPPGLGSILPEQRVTEWRRFLADVIGTDGDLEVLPDEAIADVPVHRYRARFAQVVTAAPAVVALNRAIAAGCEAFPLRAADLRGRFAEQPCLLEVWTGAEDGYPYRVTMELDEVDARWHVTTESTPMPEPFEITRPI